MSRKDVHLLDSHIRNKQTSCNLTADADKHEITSYKIDGSHAFIESIHLASSDVLLIRAGEPKQMPQS